MQSVNPPVDCPTVQDLAIRGIQRRSELPQRRSPAAAVTTSGKGNVVPFIDCPGFMRRGACPEFNQRRRCSHHHPFDAHIVETPKPRCPQVRFKSTLPAFQYADFMHRDSPCTDSRYIDWVAPKAVGMLSDPTTEAGGGSVRTCVAAHTPQIRYGVAQPSTKSAQSHE